MSTKYRYKKYARMGLVNRRADCMTQVDVAWISDLTRPFIIVLLKVPTVSGTLSLESHLGVACES